ncbi:MAG: YdeI/OmpD-associated family protein, partial [Thermoleophilaceae bacterium]
RSQLLVTPRKRGSRWSKANKDRIEQLTAAGLMAPAGLAAVERAKADGSWSALDAVEALIEPDDLRAALDGDEEARRQWDGFPPSTRRGILEWILAAKRPPTRVKRVTETVTLAAEGVRANQWRPPTGADGLASFVTAVAVPWRPRWHNDPVRNRRLLETIEGHMERGNDLMDEVREEIRLTREEVRLSREQHADLRVFIREASLRAERFTEGVLAELRALSAGQDDLREESRAQTQALLRVLDRLGPGPSPA